MKKICINGNILAVSEKGRGLFPEDKVADINCQITFEMMYDCLSYIYDLIFPSYPNAIFPQLYIAKVAEINAYAFGNAIIVNTGLIKESAALIEKRFSDAVLERYGILSSMKGYDVRSAIRVYLWRYVVLHELYHIWNQHSVWENLYYYDETGTLRKRLTQIPPSMEATIREEKVKLSAINKDSSSDLLEIEYNLTSQAIEMDADSSAVCMLINLMMRDTAQRTLNNVEKIVHIRREVALIMGALSTAFCLLDGNAGAKFEALKELNATTHPLPAIRMAYAEEIADGCLNNYFSDRGELSYIEEEWNKLVCDVDADHDGIVDMGQVFYYTAYTRAAQEHISLLKRRMIDMYDTLSVLALANTASKLDVEDTQVLECSIWFTDDGVSLRGWQNPATDLPKA